MIVSPAFSSLSRPTRARIAGSGAIVGVLALAATLLTGCGASLPSSPASASAPPRATPSALQDFTDGQAAANNGQYNRAITFYLRAVLADPIYVQAYNGLGYCYQQVGSPNAAILEYGRAIQIDPTNYGLYIARAGAENQNGSSGAAIADDRTALRLAPPQSPTYVSIADSFSSLTDLADAVTTIDQAIALVPSDTSLYEKRAGYYLSEHDYARAYADYRMAIQLAPFLAARASIYGDLASVYDQDGDYPSAMRAVDTAVQLEPANSQLYLQAATIHQHGGDYRGALTFYDRVLHLPGAQDNAETVFEGEGDVLGAMGNNTAAIADYKRAYGRTNPKNASDAAVVRPRLLSKIKALQSGPS